MVTTNLNIAQVSASENPTSEVNLALQEIDDILSLQTTIDFTADANKTLVGADVEHFFALDFTDSTPLTARRTVTFPGNTTGVDGGHKWVMRNSTGFVLTLTLSGSGITVELPRDGRWYLISNNTFAIFNLGSVKEAFVGRDAAWDGTDIDLAATQVYEYTGSSVETPTASNEFLMARAFILNNGSGGATVAVPTGTTVLAGTSPAAIGEWIELWCIDDDETTPLFVAWIR